MGQSGWEDIMKWKYPQNGRIIFELMFPQDKLESESLVF